MENNLNSKKEPVNSTTKVTSLMTTICQSHTPQSIRDLEQRTGISKSSIGRILQTLEEQGWVYRDPQIDRYRVGIRFLLLKDDTLLHHELISKCQTHMKILAEQTHKTVILSVLEGDHGLCINSVEPQGSYIKFVAHKGSEIPLHTAAAGRVLLAYSPPDTQEKILKSLKDSIPQKDLQELKQDLKTIRQKGYSFTQEKWMQNAADLSMPILDKEGNLIAQMGLAALAGSFDKDLDEQLSLLKKTIQASTEALN